MFPLKFTGTFSEKLFLYDCSIGRHVLGNVGDGIARALDVRRGKRHAVRVDREHAVAVDDVVPIQPGRPQLFAGRAGHALVDHRADHLPVRHFLRTDVVECGADAVVRHGEALGEVAQRSAELGVRPAILRHQQLSHLQIRFGDVDRILQSFFINPHMLPSLQLPRPFLVDPGAGLGRRLAKVHQRTALLFVLVDQLLQLDRIGQIVCLRGGVVRMGVEVEPQFHTGEARLSNLVEQGLLHGIHQQHPPT